MSILRDLRAMFRRDVPITVTVPASVGGKDADGIDAETMYETQPAVKTVVDFLARNVAQLPLKVYRRDGEDRRRDRDGPMALLLEHPNPHQTRYELIRDLMGDLKLYDFALWLVGPSADSPSGWEVRHIPVAWLTKTESTDGFGYSEFRFADRHAGGREVTVSADQCVVFHGYRPGDPREGSSTIRALKETLREQVAAQEYRRQAWERGMRVTGYVTRPVTVEPWDAERRKRFAESVRSAWGRGGERAGGTPVFEDGMTYHEVQFNAREADWAQGVKLSRAEAAAAFHVNPTLIWHDLQTQTYASAKDNARQLYADTLAPDLTFIQERVNMRLREIIGEPPEVYAEFDMSAKLQGSFEEQAASIQASTGAPWMTIAEARSRMNLPYIEGTDQLIVPLNVAVGMDGRAAADEGEPATNSAPIQRVMIVGAPTPPTKADAPREVKAMATEGETARYEDVLTRFFERQSRSVLAAIGAKRRKADDDADDGWWDPERWDAELADDLLVAALAGSEDAARRALELLGIDPDGYDVEATRAFLAAMMARRAAMVNQTTKQALDAALAEDVSEDAAQATPEGVFEVAKESRAKRSAATLATSVAAWATLEAGRQCAPATATKTWVVGSNPRASHAAMAGATVPLREPFPNGAQWPGDSSVLDAADVCNCNCTVTLTIP